MSKIVGLAGRNGVFREMLEICLFLNLFNLNSLVKIDNLYKSYIFSSDLLSRESHDDRPARKRLYHGC